MNKSVSIIGANSYIARNLYYILSRKIPSPVKLYDYQELHFDSAPNYYSVNILSKESVSEINFNTDIIFLFAGKTGSLSGFDEYVDFININEIGLLNVLDEYRRQNSKAKLIFPSTRLVYKGSDMPLNESAEKSFNTVYAVNKYACEQFLQQYNTVFGLDYCVFRICLPYGTMIPYASSYGTADFMLRSAREQKVIKIYGDGSLRRTITNIYDLCEIIIKGALSDKCINDIYNIGGENYSLYEMAEKIAGKYNALIEFVPFPKTAELIETGSTVFDDSKIKDLININYSVRFEDWVNTL